MVLAITVSARIERKQGDALIQVAIENETAIKEQYSVRTFPSLANVGYNQGHAWHGISIYARGDGRQALGTGWVRLPGGGGLLVLRQSG